MTIWGPFHQFLLGEDYETELLELELRQGEKVLRGNGRLTCKIGGEREFWAMTQGETIPNSWGQLEIGAMIPDSHYWSLDAKNLSGYSISLSRLDAAREIHRPNPTVIWKGNHEAFRHCLVFVRVNPSNEDRLPVCKMLLTETDSGGLSQWFSKDVSVRLSTELGDVMLTGVSDCKMIATIEGTEGVQLERWAIALVHALEFVSGKRWIELVRRTQENQQEVEQIPVSEKLATGSIMSPLGPYSFTEVGGPVWNDLLIKAIDYFYKPESVPCQRQLWALFNTANCPFSVSGLIACSILEGLCNELKESVPDSISQSQLEVIEKFVFGESFREACDNSHDDEAISNLSKRIIGSLKSVNRQSVSNLLRKWCQDGKYGLKMETRPNDLTECQRR